MNKTIGVVISFAYWTTGFLVVQRVPWAWVKADHGALRFVALSPNARGLAENMYRGIVVMDRLRASDGDRQPYDETKARERTERSGLWRGSNTARDGSSDL
jgi:hypothetical protein